MDESQYFSIGIHDGATQHLLTGLHFDSIVKGINSYYLAGSHNEAVILEDITRTIIEYGNGKTYVIEGYLDVGLIDTMHDCLICAVGSIVFALVVILGYFKIPKLNKILIPQIKE